MPDGSRCGSERKGQPSSPSIYVFVGDFADVPKHHAKGAQQNCSTDKDGRELSDGATQLSVSCSYARSDAGLVCGERLKVVDGPVGRSVAIFFYAGDFADVLRRHASGTQQIYATHGEVAQLILGLRSAGVHVTIYSYVTDAAKDEIPMDGVRVISLGGTGVNRGMLKAAIQTVDADTIVAHFAYPELLSAAIKSGKRVFAGLANSYNERGLKQFVRRWRIARLLNNPGIRMITNHCVPATEHLARIGVARHKLIPWDVPHRFRPIEYPPKDLTSKDWYEVAYAGSIAELKGVGDLIRAIAVLKSEGLHLRASFAGLGDIENMQELAHSLGVSGHLTFRGIIGNVDVFMMNPFDGM